MAESLLLVGEVGWRVRTLETVVHHGGMLVPCCSADVVSVLFRSILGMVLLCL